MLKFAADWDSSNNNNAPNALQQDALRQVILEAMASLRITTNDPDFIALADVAEADSPFMQTTVIKGMHQETGNGALTETHCTLQYPNFPPNQKRFHIFFWWLKSKKGYAWRALRVTCEVAYKQYVSIELR